MLQHKAENLLVEKDSAYRQVSIITKMKVFTCCTFSASRFYTLHTNLKGEKNHFYTCGILLLTADCAHFIQMHKELTWSQFAVCRDSRASNQQLLHARLFSRPYLTGRIRGRDPYTHCCYKVNQLLYQPTHCQLQLQFSMDRTLEHVFNSHTFSKLRTYTTTTTTTTTLRSHHKPEHSLAGSQAT